jgi:hypothetical protein
MSAPTPVDPTTTAKGKGKRTVDDEDFEPPMDDESEGEDADSGSSWSEVESDDLSGEEEEEDYEDDEQAKKRRHRKARKEVWRGFTHAWQRLGFFLEAGNRFSVVEKHGYYVIKKHPSKGENYLLNKCKLLEENGFWWSDSRQRWQLAIAKGKHDPVSWKPEGFVYKTDGQLDVFDDFA